MVAKKRFNAKEFVNPRVHVIRCCNEVSYEGVVGYDIEIKSETSTTFSRDIPILHAMTFTEYNLYRLSLYVDFVIDSENA